MVRTIMASIFAVFLFMGINLPQQEAEQGAVATAASLFVPAAIAGEDKDSKDTSSTSTSGVLICSALSVVQQKVSTRESAEHESADSEKEAKKAKDEAESKKAEVDDDDSASESEKKDEDKHAKEKDDEYKKAKKEHDDTKSKLSEAQTELAAAQTAVSTSPCTTVSGKPGYWSNAAGTPAPTTSTAPKSLREMHGQ